MPAGGATQSMAQSLASVAEPPLPKMMSLPPWRSRSWMASVASPMRSLSSPATVARSAASSATFIRIEEATWASRSTGACFSRPRKG